MKTTDLKAAVFESLKNAIDNGYDMKALDAAQIAVDLADYDPQFEGCDQTQLTPIIEYWLAK